MSHKHYPKWKYHAVKPAQVVPHEDAEKALGAGWVDSPAHLAPKADESKSDVGSKSDEVGSDVQCSGSGESVSKPAKAKKAAKKPKKAAKEKAPVEQSAAVEAEEEI